MNQSNAESLAWGLRNVDYSDLERMPGMALRAFRHVLMKPDPTHNSDLAEHKRRELLYWIDRILGH